MIIFLTLMWMSIGAGLALARQQWRPDGEPRMGTVLAAAVAACVGGIVHYWTFAGGASIGTGVYVGGMLSAGGTGMAFLLVRSLVAMPRPRSS